MIEVATFAPRGCELGKSGHCAAGKHGTCAHRRGGVQEAGSWSPECHISFGGTGSSRVPTGPGWSVISPSHIWRCSCECHQAPPGPEQMALF